MQRTRFERLLSRHLVCELQGLLVFLSWILEALSPAKQPNLCAMQGHCGAVVDVHSDVGRASALRQSTCVVVTHPKFGTVA
mmetsp:Transcript_30412/g.70737  ORF Transcript_30412/g.70737 Transcript_30412/m.70737 type:complete len:81 (+) Transcript_30412:150-392(+)